MTDRYSKMGRQVFYRHRPDDVWRCYFDLPREYCYSNSKDWLRYAEAMMRGDRPHVLWRHQEQLARDMIWC